jgi:squalene synthase HpnC
MEVDHYETLPVAPVLLPRALRAPFGAIYHVARTANDIVDEGDWSPAARHASLADLRAGLDAVAAGEPAPVHPLLFARLADVVAQFKLPLEPFHELMTAFEQDIDVHRYAERPALYEYCRHAANPVGRLTLHLFGLATPENLADSDAICTGLQLVNFCQDVAQDWQRGRLYIPQTDLARFGVTETQIARGTVNDAWRALMRHEVAVARELLVRGAPLARRFPGRFGLQLCGVVHGGLRILERIEKAGYDVFRQRPALDLPDWCVVAARTVAMWLSGRVGVRAPSIEGSA